MKTRKNPDEDLIRRIRKMIQFGLSSSEIVDTLDETKGEKIPRNDIYFAYKAALLLEGERANPRKRRKSRKNPTSMRIGDTVVLPPGHFVGMGKLRSSVEARIVTSSPDGSGGQIFKAEWVDAKGKKKSTWFGFESGRIV